MSFPDSFRITINAYGQQYNLAGQLVGEWRNESLKVKINSFNNTDSIIISVSKNVKDWEKNLQIRPIRNFFNPDGTYYSEYRTLSDSIFRKPSATWIIEGDSIIMNGLQPEKAFLNCIFTSTTTSRFSRVQ